MSAATSRRIRRRADLWRSWRIAPEQAREQLNSIVSRSGLAEAGMIADAIEHNSRGLRRAMAALRREGIPSGRSASYWREQVMRWLAALRSIKAVTL